MSMTTMKRTLLLTCALGLVSATAGAAVSDVVSATDDILFSATTPKVSLEVKGFKSLPAGLLSNNAQVGEWAVKTLDGVPARLAVSFGTNHMPVAGAGKDTVSASLTSDKGNGVDVLLKQSTGLNVETVTEQGAKWLVTAEDAADMKGTVRAYQDQEVEADAYSFTMNAAIYNI